MSENLKSTHVAMTTLICRIGVKFERCKPMTRVHLTRGITTTFLFPLGRSSSRYSRFYPQSVVIYVMDESYPFFAPVLVPSVPLLSGGEGVGVGDIAVAGPPPPGTTATTSIVAVGLVPIRNDENSADLTKSFQELSRRLPVLVNSGYLLGSFSFLVRAGFSLPDYLENLVPPLFSLFLLLKVCDLSFFSFSLFLSLFLSFWSST